MAKMIKVTGYLEPDEGDLTDDENDVSSRLWDNLDTVSLDELVDLNLNVVEHN